MNKLPHKIRYLLSKGDKGYPIKDNVSSLKLLKRNSSQVSSLVAEEPLLGDRYGILSRDSAPVRIPTEPGICSFNICHLSFLMKMIKE